MAVWCRSRDSALCEAVEDGSRAAITVNNWKEDSLGAQFAKERIILLAQLRTKDHGAPAWRRRFGRGGCCRHRMQELIAHQVEGVNLVRGPEISAQILAELLRRTNPIFGDEFIGKLQVGKTLGEMAALIFIERAEKGESALNGGALLRKAGVKANDLTQQNSAEHDRQIADQLKTLDRELLCQRRISIEIALVHLTRPHHTTSARTVPCPSGVGNPSSLPTVGTRSTDSTARSTKAPCRTPGPSTIIHV